MRVKSVLFHVLNSDYLIFLHQTSESTTKVSPKNPQKTVPFPTCLIWGWMSRCRSPSPSFPPSRSSPCPAPSRPRRRQCPPGTWRASGRRRGRRRTCTRPGSWSGRGRCDWVMGSVWWGDREEAERPTDLRGGRGMGTDVSIGRQRVRVRRREKEWAIGESKVSHQHAKSEQDSNKEKTEIMTEMKRVQCDSEREFPTTLPVRAMLSANQLVSFEILWALRGMRDRRHRILTDRKAWTMSALTELRGLSLITTKICSSFSRPMKFPNHDFFASLVDKQKIWKMSRLI